MGQADPANQTQIKGGFRRPLLSTLLAVGKTVKEYSYVEDERTLMEDFIKKELNTERTSVSAQQLTLFAEVIAVMARRGLPCWIDQGSLLGAIREGSFFSWDHDIDLGTTASLEQLEDVILELAAKGASVEVHPYVLKLRRDRGEKIIDLRLYEINGHRATAELASTPEGPRPFLFRVGLRSSKKWQRRAARLLSWVAPDLDGAASGACQRMRRAIALWILRHLLLPAGFFRNRYRSRRVFFEVDAAYFRHLRPWSIYGLAVQVPSDPEAYLAMKYGADWRQPNPDWIYWRDDGALVSSPARL